MIRIMNKKSNIYIYIRYNIRIPLYHAFLYTHDFISWAWLFTKLVLSLDMNNIDTHRYTLRYLLCVRLYLNTPRYVMLTRIFNDYFVPFLECLFLPMERYATAQELQQNQLVRRYVNENGTLCWTTGMAGQKSHGTEQSQVLTFGGNEQPEDKLWHTFIVTKNYVWRQKCPNIFVLHTYAENHLLIHICIYVIFICMHRHPCSWD